MGLFDNEVEDEITFELYEESLDVLYPYRDTYIYEENPFMSLKREGY